MFLADLPAQGTPIANVRISRSEPTAESSQPSFRQVAEALRAEGQAPQSEQGTDNRPDAPDPESLLLPEVVRQVPAEPPAAALPGAGPAELPARDALTPSLEGPVALAGTSTAPASTNATADPRRQPRPTLAAPSHPGAADQSASASGPHPASHDVETTRARERPPGPAPDMLHGKAPGTAGQAIPLLTAPGKTPPPDHPDRAGRDRQPDRTRPGAAQPIAQAQGPAAGPLVSARASLTLSAAMPPISQLAEAMDPLLPEQALHSQLTTSTSAQLTTSGPILAQRGPVPVPQAQQLALAVATTPGGDVEVALTPEELGTVRLRIEGREGAWVITVLSDRPETLDFLRRSQSDLAASFSEAGYDNPSFDFGGDDGAGSRDQDTPRTRVTAAMAADGAAAPGTLTTPTLGPGRAGLDLKL